MPTQVVRLDQEVCEQAKSVAALRGDQPGKLIASAWKEYLANHREEFAADLEHSAKLLRDGSLEDLVSWVNEDVEEAAQRDADSVGC